MAPECVQVKIEIGHKSVCRTDTTQEGFTHDWVVFVRGADGCNISHFVEKVVFHLHESFPKPKRVIKLPPYKVEESGYGSFMLMIEIYFRNKEEPKKVKFDYDLYLQLVGNPPVTNVRVEALTFSDPVEDFKKKLIKGGGVIVSSAGVSGSSTSPSNTNSATPVNKPDAMSNPQATLSPPTSSPPQSVKNPKKTSPSTPVQTSALASKAPKVREKDTPSPVSNMGIKRSNTDDTPLQKVKKKKIDKAGEGMPKAVPKEVSIIGQPDPEKDKTKAKLSGQSSKIEVKERRKSNDTTGNLGSDKLKSTSKISKEGKKEGLKEVKSKENKEKIKKDKMRKPEEKVPDEPKVQKLTVKRTSSDAWSSTTKSGNIVQGKTSLDALLNEFGADDSAGSEEEDGDIETPASSNVDINTEADKVHTNKNKKAALKTKSTNNTPNISSPKVNGVKKKDVSSPQNGKTTGDTNPLVELWTRISTTEDRDTLQKIVDIVESTGKFEVTDSTFDFDLCCLDNETIDKLRESLSVR